MSRHFHYRSLDELRAEVARLGLDIGFEEELRAVAAPVRIGSRTAGNALAIHPMEGCDGTLDGKPDELTFRRWNRFGAGGAKLIWGEATAVVPEGRANTRQLWINDENLKEFARLIATTRAVHRERFGREDDLLVGLQLTHSGKWSCGRRMGAESVSDGYLEELEEAFAAAARRVRDAGFDFVDIKQCHTYLLNELLAARGRPGRYGGSFENRTRFVRNVFRRIREELGGSILLASRINAFDGIPFARDPETGIGRPAEVEIPYLRGFGVDPMDPLREDLDEPLRLVEMLRAEGLDLLNVSMGSPYFNPHVGRPYERPAEGQYEAPEHPLAGVERHFRLTAAFQERFPDLPVVGTGYSWLQRFFIQAAESNLRRRRVTIAGVGRGALAYPDFARDLFERGALEHKRICLSVSFCTDLMRSKHNDLGQFPTGCVPRDELYAAIYKEAVQAEKSAAAKKKPEET